MLTTYPNNIPTCASCQIDDCIEYISPGVCKVCGGSSFLNFMPESCIACPVHDNNFQYDYGCDDTRHCLQAGTCVDNCNKCITPQECQVCSTGYYITDDFLCAKCLDACTECSGIKTCTVCAANNYLTYANACIICTADGQTIDETKCHLCTLKKCKNCGGTSDNDCYECRKGFYLLTVGGVKSCDPCQVGYTIYDTTLCRKCFDFMCVNCNSESQPNCLECSQGYYLKNNGGAITCDLCISASTPGWYRSTVDRVDKCVKTSCSDLDACVDFISDSVCNDCGVKKIRFATRWEDTVCVPCDGANEKNDGKYCYLRNDCTPNCDKCYSSNECGTCASSYFLTKEKTCSKCRTGCSTCVWSDTCTECPEDRCLLGDDCILYTTEGIVGPPQSKSKFKFF
jgi:proprotein convertase subtilisin/kexin type 5